MGAGDKNSGLSAHTASSLTTEPSTQTLFWHNFQEYSEEVTAETTELIAPLKVVKNASVPPLSTPSSSPFSESWLFPSFFGIMTHISLGAAKVTFKRLKSRGENDIQPTEDGFNQAQTKV